MEPLKAGTLVTVHYTGQLEDGSIFDSSQGGEPLSFTLGEGHVIPGFEKAVQDLEPGQTCTTRIPPDEGYGPRREDLMVQVAPSQLPRAVEVGEHLELSLGEGTSLPVLVTEVTDTTVTFDANHPLAGKTLIFDIELVRCE